MHRAGRCPSIRSRRVEWRPDFNDPIRLAEYDVLRYGGFRALQEPHRREHDGQRTGGENGARHEHAR